MSRKAIRWTPSSCIMNFIYKIDFEKPEVEDKQEGLAQDDAMDSHDYDVDRSYRSRLLSTGR